MKRDIFLALPVLVALAGCSSLPDISSLPEMPSLLTPYRIDVRQGNYVTQEMMAQLKVGQTKDQVRFILGTPLVVDMFHGERWDYVYRFQPGRGEVQQRRMSAYFADNKLTRVAGDVVTSALAPAAPPAAEEQKGPKGQMRLDPSMAAPSGK